MRGIKSVSAVGIGILILISSLPTTEAQSFDKYLEWTEFDVWVNGEDSKRLIYTGVPTSGNLLFDGMFVDVVPFTYRASTSISAYVTMTPLWTGDFRVGFGYQGYNAGFQFYGIAGQPIEFRVDWSEPLYRAVLGYNVDCDKRITLSFANLGINRISHVLGSVGDSFSDADPFYLNLERETGWLGGDSVGFRYADCGGQVIFDTEHVPTGISQAQVKVRNWWGTMTEIPDSITIRRDDIGGWDDGYSMWFGGGITGSVSGVVNKFGVDVPVSIEADGLSRLEAYWKGESPWLHLGARFADVGDDARIEIFDSTHMGITATNGWDGILFNNDWALDKRLRPGECATAFYGAVEECALTRA